MNAPQLADQLRDIPLRDLLQWHGFEVKPEGITDRARNDRHNIVVTGSRWFDNRHGVGGAGAIDLQMHLSGEDFSAACRTLADQFRPRVVVHVGLSFPSEHNRRAEQERRPFHELAARYAVPDESNWPLVRAYLVGRRKIDPAVVDDLHATGSIYANDHRPHPSIVFLHRTPHGKVEGATLRDTRHESAFRPCLGNKLTAWFTVGHLEQADTVVAVESPIDALSYYTIYAGRRNGLAVASCAGATVPYELMVRACDRRQAFVVALDNDPAGERGWSKAWDETVDLNLKISAECPRHKDWSEDLMALDKEFTRLKAKLSVSHG